MYLAASSYFLLLLLLSIVVSCLSVAKVAVCGRKCGMHFNVFNILKNINGKDHDEDDNLSHKRKKLHWLLLR